MAEVYHEVHMHSGVEHGMSVLERLIYLAGGIVMVLLAIRFVLVLVGANALNGFVNFIYNITYPLASPFFGIFNYQQNFEGHHFEWASLIALVVYGILMAIAARLVTIGSHRHDVAV
ncbi:MAG TPA: YggT family protein [Candidatus Saccharimonadales bacterium]|nr:YggT family protein [Candidatus Saccharimonadales bacterium]